MAERTLIRKNAYFDSVTLMSISGKVKQLDGVADVVVSMATSMNKELLQGIGLLTDEAAACAADDLVIAVRARDSKNCDLAISEAENALTAKASRKTGTGKTQAPSTISTALKILPEANLAVISVPGEHAAREAMEALRQGLHVMMFSDNVSVEDEIKLKSFAHSAGLLMMGPDCGTAIINGTGLCFANAVRTGKIGIVGASGTGTQEVSVLIDRMGGGVSQVLGTGGRDLSEAVGGIMMLDCLAALEIDEKTEVIVLISKPPAKPVASKILIAAGKCSKPVVVCFLNSEAPVDLPSRVCFCRTLEGAAIAAVQSGYPDLAAKAHMVRNESDTAALIADARSKFSPEQVYVRGLFCGGTLCDEAVGIASTELGPVFSNIAKNPAQRLKDSHVSHANAFVDLGDDAFTAGKPHPMIEPGLRLPRLLQEAADPSVAVILLDVILGLGSHQDPAGMLYQTILDAKAAASKDGRSLAVVAYVCGTDRDTQNRVLQEQKLSAAGAILAQTNAAAAKIAVELIAKRGGGK